MIYDVDKCQYLNSYYYVVKLNQLISDSSVDLGINMVDENGENFDVKKRRMKDNELFATKKIGKKNLIWLEN